MVLEISQSTESISKPQYPQDATLILAFTKRLTLGFIQRKQENIYCLQHQNDSEIDLNLVYATDILVTSIQ